MVAAEFEGFALAVPFHAFFGGIFRNMVLMALLPPRSCCRVQSMAWAA